MGTMNKIDEFKFKRNLGLLNKAFIKVGDHYLYLKDKEYTLVSSGLFQLRDSNNKLHHNDINMKDSFEFKSAHLTNWGKQIDIGMIDDINKSLIRSWRERTDRRI